MKRFMAFMLVAVMMISLVPDTAYAASKKGSVKSVKITKPDTKTLVLKKKKSYKLKTKVTVTGKASKKVTYSSSNKKVATVNKSGKIKAIKKGTAKITVKSAANKKKKATLKVIVGTPVTKVKLNKTTASGRVGDTISLKATVSPKKPSIKKVSFESSDKEVATVNSKGVVTLVGRGKATITAKSTDGNAKKATCTVTVADKISLDYKDYGDPVWVEEFNGTSLDKKVWNVETHDPGWVNEEWQAYVDSTDNIYVKDGKLVLKPIKKVGADGKATYTSGRVNTQNKKTFKYGLFECVAKVPAGQGYLPAFWMMPNDESLYGQWPKCGEIDCMEVMGQETNKVYGTIHYGEPHGMSQGTYVLDENDKDFASEFHKYSCEWEPGIIRWYIDGVLYHEERDWHSTTENQGTVAYPAPFDQDFYIILNLAVGGSWVGYPNDATKYGDDALFQIDSVKVYQKKSYDENVTPPEKKPLVFKKADANGNYITNGDFAVAEDLTDEKDWQFMTANGGAATAKIANKSIGITTTKAGTEDYSVQLVQAGLPAQQLYEYEVKFDAVATSARTMNVAVKAPDRSYIAYMSENVDVTTTKKTYTYTYKMTQPDDANSRLEFNMGKAGTAGLTISNVSLKVKKAPTAAEIEASKQKKVLADGNCIYNGKFQEGTNRLAYWDVKKAAGKDVTVTDLKDGRRLKVTAKGGAVSDVTVSQSTLPMQSDTDYLLSFDIQASKATTIKYTIGGVEKEVDVPTTNYKYKEKFSKEEIEKFKNKDIVFYFGNADVIWMDNVRLEEDALIINGKFNAGTTGFDVFVDSSADASYVVDSLNEDNALDLTIKNTSDAEWKVQVKQGDVLLEKGQWYKLSFDIRSSIARSVQYSIQRNGAVHKNAKGEEDWTPYVQDTVKLPASTKKYEHIEAIFQMEEETDDGSIFNIGLGGRNNKTQHRICIDNISLVKTDAPEDPDPSDEELNELQPIGENLLSNGDFAKGEEGWSKAITGTAAGTWTISDGKAKVEITNPGSADWNVGLKQENLMLYAKQKYEVTATFTSDVDRTCKFSCMDAANKKWYVKGSNDIVLKAGVPQTVVLQISELDKKDKTAYIAFNLGSIVDNDGVPLVDDAQNPLVPTASKVEISNVSLKRVENYTETGSTPEDPENPDPTEEELASQPVGTNLLKDSDFGNADGSWIGIKQGKYEVWSFADNVATATITNPGSNDWDVALKQAGLTLYKGQKYEVTATVESNVARSFKFSCMDSTDTKWYVIGDNTVKLDANTPKPVKFEVGVTSTDKTAYISFNLGRISKDGLPVLDEKNNPLVPDSSEVKISNVTLKRVDDTPIQGTNLLASGVKGKLTDWQDKGPESITIKVGDESGVKAISDVQLQTEGINIENGKKYKVSFKITSADARKVVSTVQRDGYARKDNIYTVYGTSGEKNLAAGEEVTVEFEFTMSESTDEKASFVIQMGTPGGTTGDKNVTITDLLLVEVTE